MAKTPDELIELLDTLVSKATTMEEIVAAVGEVAKQTAGSGTIDDHIAAYIRAEERDKDE